MCIAKWSDSNLLSFQVSLTAEEHRLTALVQVSHCRGKFFTVLFYTLNPYTNDAATRNGQTSEGKGVGTEDGRNNFSRESKTVLIRVTTK
jgi:hypothetical protein